MRFGSIASDGYYHLKDEELDRVVTEGTLYIGDWNSTKVNEIIISGITYVSANSSIWIWASAFGDSDVIFTNEDSNFTHKLQVLANGFIRSDVRISVFNELFISADDDCDLTGNMLFC